LTDAGVEGMCISVDPGSYSITAGEWGGVHTQTHIVKLSGGQSANLNFSRIVFQRCFIFIRFIYQPQFLQNSFSSGFYHVIPNLIWWMKCFIYNILYCLRGV